MMLRRRLNERRSGQNISADFAIAMGLFTVTIAIGIFYTTSVIAPSSPFSTQLESTAIQASQTLQTEGGWTVHRTPVVIEAPPEATSETVEDFPYMLSSVIPTERAEFSGGVREGGTLLPYHINYTTNTTAFVTDIDSQTERFTVTTQPSGTFLPPAQDTELTATTDSADTGDINLTWTGDGFSDLYLDGERLVHDLSLGTTGRDTSVSDATARSTFPDGAMTAFTGSPVLYLDPEGTETIDITLPGDMDEMEWRDGSSDDLSNGSVSRTGIDSVNMQGGGDGLLLAGDFNIDGSKSGTVELDVTTGARLLVLPHDQGESVEAERELFLEQTVHELPMRPVEGLSRDRIDTLIEGETRPLLGLQDVGYNITVDGSPPITFGSRPPSSADQSVFETPAVLMDQFGRTNLTSIEVTIWP